MLLCHASKPLASAISASTALIPHSDSTLRRSAAPGDFRRCRPIERRATEARRRRRLPYTVDLDECLAHAVVRMVGRLLHRQHRREARIAAFQQRAPFIARAGAEALG